MEQARNIPSALSYDISEPAPKEEVAPGWRRAARVEAHRELRFPPRAYARVFLRPSSPVHVTLIKTLRAFALVTKVRNILIHWTKKNKISHLGKEGCVPHCLIPNVYQSLCTFGKWVLDCH